VQYVLETLGDAEPISRSAPTIGSPTARAIELTPARAGSGFVEAFLRSENPHDLHKSDAQEPRQPLLAGRDGLTRSPVGSSDPRGMRVRVHGALDTNEAVSPQADRSGVLAQAATAG
jgi:hypothetical protein